VHDEDAVCVHYGVEAVRDLNHGARRQALANRLLQRCGNDCYKDIEYKKG
jgi:hypothetical protein